MKLWHISQTEKTGYGTDTHDSAVVAAETEDEARNIHPYGLDEANWKYNTTWCYKPEQVLVRLIGEAIPETPPGVICASFNAG